MEHLQAASAAPCETERPRVGAGAAGAAGHADTAIAPAVDRKHLARYTLGDSALEDEILGLFLDQLPRTIDTLRRAATDMDWVRAAHTLKGSSRCVGAWRLARAGEQAERIGGIADRRSCQESIWRIETAAAEVRAVILSQPRRP